MKLLTITQPYATLIAFGAKRIETRPKQTHYRGDIAIHAASGLDGIFKGAKHDDLAEVCRRPFFRDVLGPAQLISDLLPRGGVVAIARLVRCTRMDEAFILGLDDDRRELAFGHYEPGRWAWELGDIRRLERPFKLRGQQMLADIEPEAVEQIRRLAIEPTGARA
jgi:hypothetical protein